MRGYVIVDATDYDIWREWLFYADSQLVDRHLEFKDEYLRKQSRHFGQVTIGNQREPFGLEQYGSFRRQATH